MRRLIATVLSCVLPVVVAINDMITTTLSIPAGVLEFGRTYVLRVKLEDLNSSALENRSSILPQLFSLVD